MSAVEPLGEPQPRGSARVPWDRDAERAVLGAVLLDPAVLDDVIEVLGAKDFHLGLHQQAFEAMLALWAEGKVVDAVTIPARMRELAAVDEVEARTYVSGLDSGLASTPNARHYAEIVRKLSLRRSIQAAAQEILELTRDDTVPVEGLAAAAEQILFAATQKSSGKDLVQIGELLKDTVKSLEILMQSPSGVTGLETGLVDLDRKTTGLHGGELIIVAGRPAMGKTTLALNFAVHAAARKSEVVAVFSLEMPEQQLVQRILASEAGVDSQKLRTGEFSTYDWQKIDEQCAKLYKTHLFLDGSSVLTASQIASKARRLKSRMQGKLGLIVVDYLQLMEAPAMRSNSSRAEDVAVMSRALKQLAKELSVPVVALAQLSRDVEKKARKPMLSDLRESGAIEQDADVVLFLHRDETEGLDMRDQPTEIIIGKQRSGPVGVIPVLFQKEVNRFVNLDLGDQGQT
ncbi:MAG TPA: replicative DNA helicase [Myxococcales bacterium]|jgi:replicative DNA helicase|nr:replicative DNA helicase [Myxococcales bacterium]